jgi:hypothetical protein
VGRYRLPQEDITMAHSKDAKSIAIKFETYTRLIRRKKYPEESFDKVLNRILDGDINEPQR